MSVPSRLLPRPEPPHDPYSHLLAGWIGADPRKGFRIARTRDVEVAAPANVLTLGPTPDVARLLTEPSGSFGGLRPPTNVAVGPGGDIYLLDVERGVLKHFDGCCCRFDAIPCATRAVDPPADPCADPAQHKLRQRTRPPLDRLRTPHGIAICDGGLWVADSGHGRVVEFALNGFVPRRSVGLPARERAAIGDWYPFALAFDGAGRLYVSDPLHGRIDRFDAQLRWLDPAITGLAGVGPLAVDCRDRVYAVIPSSRAFGPIPLPAAGVTYASFDAGVPWFDWQRLRMGGVPLAASLDVDVTASGEALTAVELAALPPEAWRRIAARAGGAIGGLALPILGAIGQRLYVRITPQPGSAAAAAVEMHADGAGVARVEGGTAVRIEPRTETLRFPRSDVIVDMAGNLHLACGDALVPFRTDGTRLPAEAGTVPPRYKRSGRLVTVALDAEIEGCQWHRVELCGAIPAGCSIGVRTATSALALTDDEVAALDPDAWCTNQLAAGDRRGRWDCLVQSPPGRYLWLAFDFQGDGHATPCLESITIEFPRVSLRRYLPAVFGADRAGADFTDRFTAIFDTSLRSIEGHLDREATFFDPLSAPVRQGKRGPVDFLSWLASWVGIALPPEWPEERRRRYFKEATRLACARGTPLGLRRQLLLLLGFDRAYAECPAERPQTRCTPRPRNCGPEPTRTPAEPPPLILEHYRLRRWLHAGRGRLGDDAVLWGKRIVNRSELSGVQPPPDQTGNARIGETQLIGVPDPLHDPFLVYAHRFSVFVPDRVRGCEPERRAFERVLASEAPAHTSYDVRYVAPRFRVGVQAMIGLDSVVARMPRGVTLTSAVLGQGTILSEPPHRRGGPHLTVGNARLGTTTLID